MGTKIIKGIAVLAVAVFLSGLSGCAGFDGIVDLRVSKSGSDRPSEGGKERQDFSTTVLMPFANNSTVDLRSAVYRGHLVINANKVTIRGSGQGTTIIDGNVQINGNSCVMRDLTVTGDIHIYGNNADLRGVDARHGIISSGNNNRW